MKKYLGGVSLLCGYQSEVKCAELPYGAGTGMCAAFIASFEVMSVTVLLEKGEQVEVIFILLIRRGLVREGQCALLFQLCPYH